MPMSDSEKELQLNSAIRDYSNSKEELIRITKKISDFRSAGTKASNMLSPGAISSLKGKPESEFTGLLSPSDVVQLVADHFTLVDRIKELGEYLRGVGYAGLVSD